MIAIDQLCYQSRLRYENADLKVIYGLLTLLFSIVSRSIWISALVLAVNAWLTVGRGGVAWRRYLHFLLVPVAFLLLSTAAIVLNVQPEPMDLFAISLGSRYLTGSWEGLRYALQLFLTSLSAVSCLYFVSMTTPMPDILNVLRKLHCPRLLLELMLLIYRYIFVLLETARAISLSQSSRLGNRDYRTSLKSFGMLGSVLMIRAIKRSKALYDAMEARCYDGTIQVLNETYPPRRRAMVQLAAFEALLLILTVGRFVIR